jgi:ferrochelatase
MSTNRQGLIERDPMSRADHTVTRAVLMIHLGTPDAPDVASVRRYLREFLSDPAVIQLPPWLSFLTRPVGRIAAHSTAPSSARMYRKIWTERGSPLRSIFDDQVTAVRAALPRGWRAYGAMRYGNPSIPAVLREIETDGIEELVVLPMYPQFSGTTTGTALREAFGFLQGDGHALQITTRAGWHDDHGYINAQAQLLRQYARSCGLTPERAFLLFTSHGIPVSHIAKGDPYRDQVARSAALVAERIDWPADRKAFAFQGQVGPARWISPYTDDALRTLVRRGERRILVCPIGFITDCVETLDALDVRFRRIVESAGAKMFLCPALNTFSPFISALKQLALRGPRPVRDQVRVVDAFEPDLRGPADGAFGHDRLVMIGLSLPGRLHDCAGSIHTATADSLRSVKRPSCEVPSILRSIRENAHVEECFLWNTCHRFELYALLAESADEKDALNAIKRTLVKDAAVPDQEIATVAGDEAWRRLVRTACGLDSGLPGERDILQQLHAAHRLAEKSGAARSRLRRLVAEVAAFDRRLRDATDWGNFDPDYTHIALSRVADAIGCDLETCRIVVLGGSTTSASVLQSLTDCLLVPSRQLTLFYRGHKSGGHLKLLRHAVGHGRRVRVQTYAESSVSRAFADADVVVFGVDRTEPILDAARLRNLRDFSVRPMTIIDFNTFGSTRDVESINGIRLFTLEQIEAAVAEYAEELVADPEFRRAAEQAERFIAKALAPTAAGDRARHDQNAARVRPGREAAFAASVVVEGSPS